MTEYEIADLALSNTALIQNQASYIQANGSLIISNLTLFYSLVFGYLLAAYIVGKQLTTTQITILSLLYLAAVIYNRISALEIFIGYIASFNTLEEMVGQPIPRGTATEWSLALITVFVILSILASLFFMWSVRHPKAERPQ
jgi:uncharacterized membrane protein